MEAAVRDLGGLALVFATVLGCPAVIVAGADTTSGPLMQAALASLEAEASTTFRPRSEKSRTDWVAVIRLRPGGEIIVTVKGAPAATRRLLRADAEGMTVLDLSDPKLPKDVRSAFLDLADRPFTLLAAQTAEQQLSRRVRATPAGVFLAEQRVAELAQVIRPIPREEMVDVRVRRKHVGSHVRRGLLIGAAIGAGLGAAIGASDEFDEPLPMMGAGALFGGVYGLGIGTVVGVLSPSSPDVIYHVD